ncbi:bifunctional precorrin-2 dehydrogenase/sirohydrochlorin ferrochelatase [Paenibacillus melissococcoides]|uniref:precorrin-2 dehydrogenase n=1 Tax=Paenibacillus melissococcoides TaxID=2912268 RepID=A0ABM9FWH4_9BACL|nr:MULTISPECIES: bifunctional precorrin-2 dehydrogenase/sirohydrochlorin ferrochelatase [Paenibacillus]MEB9894110.1 bifunctional precorrin-2 dehydrogenase/sirohydrochlorin ferrochelatase [Bacillus cereus]CAH8243336.1 bifunctional precorrin-2 dehydrogenase/sirohydrochlorin ferrochelatase [Paenibacillus melissococcoides]CAH8704213.1 bifunctional precorrin-2 dehydrogenase/sirohydrochlorin ferrochelatase [Paenibacillus melissococcoides]CAH8707479.1 bifunctional precorrin-2 dehydrogenase/sirohydroch
MEHRDEPCPLYPMMLRLAGRRCVVIGGGSVAARKVSSLLASGAEVTVVSPRLTPELGRLAHEGRIACRERDYEPADVEGALLVFAATDRPAVNERVAEDARRAGALVNLAHDPEGSDFANPGSARKGMIQVAVYAGGASPTLTRRLTAKLAGQVDDGLADLAARLSSARRDTRARIEAPERRHELLRRYAGDCWQAYEQGKEAPAWDEWLAGRCPGVVGLPGTIGVPDREESPGTNRAPGGQGLPDAEAEADGKAPQG